MRSFLLIISTIILSSFLLCTSVSPTITNSISNNDSLNNLELIKTIKVQGNKIYSDPLENYYIATQNSIWKTSSQNNNNFVFSAKKSGNINYIDAGDPMKILVFYKDLSLITFLDNFLAEESLNIQLLDFNLDQAEVVCKSLNNGIWVYEAKQDKLVKINNNLQQEIEILNVQRMLGEAFAPKQMLERTSGLYLNDPEKGIFVFDNYGAFLRKIPETNISKFNVFENVIAFRKGNEINTLNTKTLELNRVYSDSTMTDFSISEKKLFILNGDSLHIYKLNP